MKRAILATVCYAVGAAAPAFLISAASLFSVRSSRPNPLDDFYLAAYLIAVSTSLSVAGFLVTAAALRRFWHRASAARAIVLGGLAGLFAPIATLAVAGVAAWAILPLFQSTRWLAAALVYGLPGVGLGVIVSWMAGRWGRRADVQPRAKIG